jgi:hypothetical protein
MGACTQLMQHAKFQVCTLSMAFLVQRASFGGRAAYSSLGLLRSVCGVGHAVRRCTVEQPSALASGGAGRRFEGIRRGRGVQCRLLSALLLQASCCIPRPAPHSSCVCSCAAGLQGAGCCGFVC